MWKGQDYNLLCLEHRVIILPFQNGKSTTTTYNIEIRFHHN